MHGRSICLFFIMIYIYPHEYNALKIAVFLCYIYIYLHEYISITVLYKLTTIVQHWWNILQKKCIIMNANKSIFFHETLKLTKGYFVPGCTLFLIWNHCVWWFGMYYIYLHIPIFADKFGFFLNSSVCFMLSWIMFLQTFQAISSILKSKENSAHSIAILHSKYLVGLITAMGMLVTAYSKFFL